MELVRNTQITLAGAAIANALNTDSNSTIIDMANWTGVIFFTNIVDSAATGVAALKVEQNTANQDAGMAPLAGAVADLVCATNDDINGKVLMVSVHKPRERYVQAVRTSLTANIAFGEIYAIPYGPRVHPTTDHATIGESAKVVSPAEV